MLSLLSASQMSNEISRIKKRLKTFKLCIYRNFIWTIGIVYRLGALVRDWITKTNYLSIALFSLVIAIILYLPSTQSTINKFQNIDTIFIAIGSMLGTVLVLAFTLSIIPIQRSVEAFSPSVSRLYRSDGTTKLIFLIISIFTIFSFVIAIDSIAFGLKYAVLFPLEILILGITLDLLRWYNRRIHLLLEPQTAISRLSKSVVDYIWKTQKRISRLSKLSFRTLPESKRKGKSPINLESEFYVSHSYHQNLINNRLSELGEIAHKSIARNEFHTTDIVISALAGITTSYINCRKENLIVFPSKDALFLANASDIDQVLHHSYEILTNIAETAIRGPDQIVPTMIIKAFGQIATYIATVKSTTKINLARELIFSPIYNAGRVIEKAHEKDLLDTVMRGCSTLESVSIVTPKEEFITHVDFENSKLYYRIIQRLLFTNNQDWINKVLEYMLSPIHIVFTSNPKIIRYNLSDVLEKIAQLLPLALTIQKKSGSSILFCPFSVPYDITNEKSLYSLVNKATELIRIDDEREWINPYSDFFEINEEIYRHFRQIAKIEDWGEMLLLRYITQCMRQIANIYMRQLSHPITNVMNHYEKLVSQLGWYLSFFLFAFSKSSRIQHQYAVEACDVLSSTALSCYLVDQKDNNLFLLVKGKILENCIFNICSIVQYYTKASEHKNQYDIADLIMNLWYIRLVANYKNEQHVLKKIDEEITKLKELKLCPWPQIEEALVIRNQQLVDKIFDENRQRQLENDKAIGHLRAILDSITCIEGQSPEIWSQE